MSHKTIKTTQVSYLPLEQLQAGMVTPDGVILAINYATRRYEVPLGEVVLDPGAVAAVLAQIAPDMLDTTVEAVEAQRKQKVRTAP